MRAFNIFVPSDTFAILRRHFMYTILVLDCDMVHDMGQITVLFCKIGHYLIGGNTTKLMEGEKKWHEKTSI